MTAKADKTTTAIVTEDHFSDFRKQFNEFKEAEEKTVFDVTTKKGEAAARSHIYKIRLTKGAVDRRHKEVKARVLQEGRDIDSAKKELIEGLDNIIEVHSEPIRALEEQREKEAEAAKLAKEQAEWDAAVIVDYDNAFEAATSHNDLLIRENALRVKEEAMQKAEDERKAKEEAEKLKKEQAERDERLKKEAAEEARVKAEKDAKAAKDRAEFLSDFDEAIAINQTVDAEKARKQAEVDKIAAEEKAAREIKEAADKKAKEDAARQANIKHRAKIHGDIKSSIMALGVDEEKAIEIVKALSKGGIENVSIQY